MQYTTIPPVRETFGYLGEIRQGPDGQLYQMAQTTDGLGHAGFGWVPLLSGQAGQGLGQAVFDQPQLGEVRAGPDGQLYQYAQTTDGLGNIGFAWASLIPLAAQVLPAITNLFNRPSTPSAPPAVSGSTAPAAGIDWSNLIPQIAQAVAGLLGGRGRRSSLSGFGAEADLYQVPPGMGLTEDELGLTDDELGLTDNELNLGDYYLGEDGGVYEFQGLNQDMPEDLRGLGQYPDEPLGLTEDDPLSGLEGYVREQPESRLQGYVPGYPSASPPFVPRADASPLWKSLW